MEILLWLVPAALATVVAMGVAGWVGRERSADVVETPALLPGEVVGRPGEGVSPARPVRVATDDAEPRRTPQRPPAPGVRRSA